MGALIFLAGLVLLNAWMSRRVLRAGPSLDHKGLLVAGIWLMPVLGAVTALNHIRFHAPDPHSRLFGSRRVRPALLRPAAPETLHPPGTNVLALRSCLYQPDNGTPVLDGAAVNRWLDRMSDDRERAQARQACHAAWLLHLRDALGPDYHVLGHRRVHVLAPLTDAAMIAGFFDRVTDEIARALHPLVGPQALEGRSVLVLIESEIDWISHLGSYDDECVDLPAHDAAFITAACPHFAARLPMSERIEVFIAWNLARQALVRLPLPVWLQAGIVGNVAESVTGASLATLTSDQMRFLQQQFWTEDGIQAFWSGRAFHKDDEQSSTLAHDLARRLVKRLSGDWTQFVEFAMHAAREDGGASAARRWLGVELAQAVCSLLGTVSDANWHPRTAAPAPHQLS